ncbi:terminase small subunit [Psychrobacter sp. BI730]|uniref:terminase small subunit n=1 Tax=Psychrobacter sp. BI730 TaxID=2705463 RepID=UPI0015CD2824|nr:terminase small subunit [Psychrobacter sp. BI730]NYR09596.1 terminase small subunit [Psychrobacter sp. BI730]
MTDEAPNSDKSALNQLEEQQQLFVLELMRDLNQTKAAIRAGYSENTATAQASRLLTNVNVKAAFNELKAIRNEQLGVDAGYVLKRLMDIDALDVADLLDDKGSIKPISEWSMDWRQNISSFEVADDGQGSSVVKLKFPDKVKNLELIGRHVDVAAWTSNQTIDLNANIKAEVSSMSDLMDEIGNET